MSRNTATSHGRLRGGVQPPVPSPPPYPPSIPARITRRADDRIRLQLTTADYAALAPTVGTVLLIELQEPDLCEVVAGQVYAVHHHELVDCRLRALPLVATDSVGLRRTQLGAT